jgi:hypothetical protein
MIYMSIPKLDYINIFVHSISMNKSELTKDMAEEINNAFDALHKEIDVIRDAVFKKITTAPNPSYMEVDNTLKAFHKIIDNEWQSLVVGLNVVASRRDTKDDKEHDVRPELREVIISIRSRLATIRKNDKTLALDLSDKAMQILCEIACDNGGHGGRKALAILGVLAEKCASGEPISLQEISRQTGYKEHGVYVELAGQLNQHILNGTAWRVVGTQEAWKLIKIKSS